MLSERILRKDYFFWNANVETIGDILSWPIVTKTTGFSISMTNNLCFFTKLIY